MNDRVHPSAKTTATTATKPSFPATKSQLSGANLPRYCPQPPNHRRRSRGCLCSLLCYLILILIFIFLLIGAAGTVFYFLYHPQRPTFSVTSFTLSSLNPTAANFDLILSTTNPNSKILFSYAPTSVSVLSADTDTAIADATIPAFRHLPKNTTVLETSLDVEAESDAVTQLKRSVKRKSEVVAVKVKLETKVVAQMAVFQTPPVGITVLCDGVGVSLADGEKPATVNGENTECEVDVKFKVWKWTVG